MGLERKIEKMKYKNTLLFLLCDNHSIFLSWNSKPLTLFLPWNSRPRKRRGRREWLEEGDEMNESLEWKFIPLHSLVWPATWVTPTHLMWPATLMGKEACNLHEVTHHDDVEHHHWSTSCHLTNDVAISQVKLDSSSSSQVKSNLTKSLPWLI